MPVFEHVSSYPHPRAEVFAWHERGGGFVRLTPPGSATIVSGPTDGIREGSELVLRISDPVIAGLLPPVPLPGFGTGPVGLPWRVRHVDYVEGERFVDEQVAGPLRSWRHEHLFSDAPGGGTTITDRVTYELPADVLGVGAAAVRRQLEGLFRFREAQLRDDLALHARLAAPASRIVVTGASGLVGTQLCALLSTGGHEVTRLVRGPAGSGEASWDPAGGRLDADALRGADAVVHLAGASIGGRFTPRHKEAVLSSRVDGTSLIARALAGDGMPRTLVQASAIGIYGARRPGETLTEDSAPGTGFLADVVRAWEASATAAVEAGVRAAFLRTGIALSGGGGALLPQLPLYLVGAGGRLGAARAWLSWITLDDLARAYVHALFTPALSGPVNAVAPAPATNAVFARALGRALHRPALVPTPGFGPALVLGREGRDQLIDTDQRVSAGKLEGSGFVFAQPALPAALDHVLAR